MATLNFDDLFGKMLSAAKTSLSSNWPAISELATSSLKTLAKNLIDVQIMLAEGTITQAHATIMIDMHKNSLETVLLAEQGLALIAVQDAINAVIGAVKDVVNAAVGVKLL